jgi:hypothetical protein
MTRLTESPRLRLSRSTNKLGRWQPVLVGRVDDAAEVIAAAQRRVPDLAAKVAVPSNADRGPLEGSILPGAALYLELRSRFGQDRALALVRACITATGERRARPFHLLDRTPWLFPIFRRWGKRMMERAMSPPTWGMRWIEASPQRLQFEITRCFYLDTLTALGIPELTAEYCHGDEVIFGHLRHLEFVRAGTLAQGCEVCDFCFERPAGGQRRADTQRAGT